MADQDQVKHWTETMPDEGVINHETRTQPWAANMHQKDEVNKLSSTNVPQSSHT